MVDSGSKPNNAVHGDTRSNLPSRGARQPIHFVRKGWGSELWLANGELYCGKLLRIDTGKKCSLHFHRLKTETFYLYSGRLLVRTMDTPESRAIDAFVLEAGECMDVPPGLIHQMEALEASELFEFSTQHFDEDSHRIEKGD